MNQPKKVEISEKRGILAGVFIGIGGTAFLSVESKPLGAFLFALGLLAVLIQKYSLFTGKVGYASSGADVLSLTKMILRNFVGAALVGLLTSKGVSERAAAVAETKLLLPLTSVFVASVFCGILIYIAVELFIKEKHPLLVVIPIMAFILCGFEHCVADAFYFASARCFDVRVIVFMAVCIAGNSVGSLAVRFAERFNI